MVGFDHGDWWVSLWRLVGFWVWIGALCVALSVAPMVIFVLAWFDGGSDGGVLAWF